MTINIIIPAAGLGSRFKDQGYANPKPFIDVQGRPMIVAVMENLGIKDANYIIILQKAYQKDYETFAAPHVKNRNVTLVYVDGLTEGTACTVLHARSLIDNDHPVLFANSDQVVDASIPDFVQDAQKRNLGGSILVFDEPTLNPKWSYIQPEGDRVIAVAEKKAISSKATVGIYYYQRGRDFVDAAIDMIARNIRTNNEFYLCPAFNQAIQNGIPVGYYEIPKEAMHGIGTPEDLTLYLNWMDSAA
jgi:dTDP-glucose pyrophosphorylase